jgi:hypothetical protein
LQHFGQVNFKKTQIFTTFSEAMYICDAFAAFSFNTARKNFAKKATIETNCIISAHIAKTNAPN